MLSWAVPDCLAKTGGVLVHVAGPPDAASEWQGRLRHGQRSATRTTHQARLGLAGIAMKYGTVGLVGVGVNSVVLLVLYRTAHVPLVAASLIAVELSIVANYLLNDCWTFSQPRPTWRRFSKFNLAAAGALMIIPCAVWGLTRLGLQLPIANLVGIAVGGGVNFTASLLWVWVLPARLAHSG